VGLEPIVGGVEASGVFEAMFTSLKARPRPSGEPEGFQEEPVQNSKEPIVEL
jgi:hypothetical protein